MAKRTGLGRGIGALIPTADQSERPVDVFFPGASLRQTSTEAAPVADAEAPELENVPGIHLVQVDPNSIVANPRQPRTHFDPEDLAELVHSVREFGVLQPVVVRKNADGEYELIMGSAARAPRARPASTSSPRSSVTPQTRICCATPCWRTSTVQS